MLLGVFEEGVMLCAGWDWGQGSCPASGFQNNWIWQWLLQCQWCCGPSCKTSPKLKERMKFSWHLFITFFFCNDDSQLFSCTAASLWFPLIKEEIELTLIKYKISFSLKELLLPSYLELGNAGWQGQIQGVVLHLSWLNSRDCLWVFFLKLPNFTVKLLNLHAAFIYFSEGDLGAAGNHPEEQKLFPEYRWK